MKQFSLQKIKVNYMNYFMYIYADVMIDLVGARIGKTLLQDVEINAVTGALKLYFRELPEALFTDELYPALIETYSMSTPCLAVTLSVCLLTYVPIYLHLPIYLPVYLHTYLPTYLTTYIHT